MIVNPDKFQSIIIQNRNQISKPEQFLIGNRSHFICYATRNTHR